MNGYQSIATIKGPEFINLQPMDINPFISECEIKVFYLGKNRNRTAIDKATAMEMAKTLRGVPIVGYYKKDAEDFRDHGDQITIDGDGVHFNSLTKPYGFVSPTAKVWFQDFQETSANGTVVTRTYLMTTGYLWTGQFEEAQQVLDDNGKPHSMELDKNSMQGFWSKGVNEDYEFFIINDAIFSKLCILGDDVEPCFEGSSITAPNVSKQFSLDEQCKNTLYSMMKELQETLQGGKEQVDMQEIQTKSTVIEAPIVENPAPVAEPVVEESTVEEASETIEASAENQAEILDNTAETEAVENGVSIENTELETDFAKKEEEDKEEKSEESAESEDDKKDDEKEKGEKSYELIIEELQQKCATLTEANSQLNAEVESLKQYKASIENAQKDALIDEFSMLSEEDKKDVIEHKAEYSLDEIKSKLAIICFDKKVSYTVEKSTEQAAPATSFTVDVQQSKEIVPEWLQAVDRYTQKY